MGALDNDVQGRITWSFEGPALPFGASTSLEFYRDNPDLDPGDWWTNFSVQLETAARDLHQLVASSSCLLTQLEVKLGPEATGPTFTIPLSTPGATGAEACPPNVAMLIRKRVNGVSGRFSGRMFYPGISEGNVASNGTIPTPALGPYQAAVDGFFDSLHVNTGGGVTPIIIPSAPGAFSRNISSLDVQVKVATQRRRLRR